MAVREKVEVSVDKLARELNEKGLIDKKHAQNELTVDELKSVVPLGEMAT